MELWTIANAEDLSPIATLDLEIPPLGLQTWKLTEDYKTNHLHKINLKLTRVSCNTNTNHVFILIVCIHSAMTLNLPVEMASASNKSKGAMESMIAMTAWMKKAAIYWKSRMTFIERRLLQAFLRKTWRQSESTLISLVSMTLEMLSWTFHPIFTLSSCGI